MPITNSAPILSSSAELGQQWKYSQSQSQPNPVHNLSIFDGNLSSKMEHFAFSAQNLTAPNRRRGMNECVQGDHGTMQQTFVDFIGIGPLPAGFGLGRQKSGRIGIGGGGTP